MAKKRKTKDIDVISEMDKILGEMFLQAFKDGIEEMIREGEEMKKNIGKPSKDIDKHKMI